MHAAVLCQKTHRRQRSAALPHTTLTHRTCWPSIDKSIRKYAKDKHVLRLEVKLSRRMERRLFFRRRGQKSAAAACSTDIP